MMNQVKYFIIGFLTLVFFSCQPEEEIEISNSMATNFFLHNGDQWDLSLVQVRDITDSLFYKNIESANITVNTSTEVFTSFDYTKGPIYELSRYVHNSQVAPFIDSNEEVVLNIDHQEYMGLRASDVMPSKIKIESLELLEYDRWNSENTPHTKSIGGIVKINLKEISVESPYLRIIVRLNNEFYNPNTVGIVGVITPDYEEQLIDSLYASEGSINYLDKSIEEYSGAIALNGEETASILLSFGGIYISQSVNEYVTIEVLSLSENYYNYLIGLDDALNQTTDAFSKPSQTYSNIEGGYGIFALANVQHDTLYIPN